MPVQLFHETITEPHDLQQGINESSKLLLAAKSASSDKSPSIQLGVTQKAATDRNLQVLLVRRPFVLKSPLKPQL